MKKEMDYKKYIVIAILGILAGIIGTRLIVSCPTCDNNMDSLKDCIENRDFYLNEYGFCSRDLRKCLTESVEIETKPNSEERAEQNKEDCKATLLAFNRGCIGCGNTTYCKENIETPMDECEYYGDYDPATWQILAAKNITLYRCDFKGDSMMVKK